MDARTMAGRQDSIRVLREHELAGVTEYIDVLSRAALTPWPPTPLEPPRHDPSDDLDRPAVPRP